MQAACLHNMDSIACTACCFCIAVAHLAGAKRAAVCYVVLQGIP